MQSFFITIFAFAKQFSRAYDSLRPKSKIFCCQAGVPQVGKGIFLEILCSTARVPETGEVPLISLFFLPVLDPNLHTGLVHILIF